LEAITEAGEKLDHCLVGEPTNPAHLGDTIKVGGAAALTA
jgi:succinyl-diaminopimelate desuccinylase